MTVAPASPPRARPSGIRRPGGLTSFVLRHRLLLIALLLVIFFHGALLVSGSYQRTYDAYVHIFFGDHYARSWFSSWDDRWYTGFSTVSYPPGAHQTIAALSGVFGLRGGFVIAQLSALIILTIGVYRSSKLWVGHRAAGWAAIILVLSSSIAETVHVFGQLPTTFSLGFLLNALPFADKWVRTGSRRALLSGVICVMATTAGHHVTTLFGSVFFIGPVLIAAMMRELQRPRPDETGAHTVRFTRETAWPLIARRIRRVWPAFVRTAVFTVLVVVVLLVVVLPYWLHSRTDPITQVSIPHASRDSFIVNTSAGLVFWLVPWGLLLFTLPYALIRGFRSRAWPQAASLAALTLLGTGGTTFIPRAILGGAYDILTLDRFTFWATIVILPFAGAMVVSATRGRIAAWMKARLGRAVSLVLLGLVTVSFLVFTLFAANLTHFRSFQPDAIDIDPIVAFIEKDLHDNWRYLTLGFGDQVAWLSANTTAQMVDGNYHSARDLPELTTRPIERIEGSKYSGVPGIGSLQQFLATPERYSLKYVFNNDDFYAPLLSASGWTNLGPLENGIDVWERADVAPLPATTVSQEKPLWQRLMWGTIPPAALVSAVIVLGWNLFGAPIPASWRGYRPMRHGVLARIDVTARMGRRWDAVLARAASRVPDEDPTGRARRWAPRLPFRHVWERVCAPRPTSRRVQAVVGVAVVAAVVATGVIALRPAAKGPGDVVTQYYDDLDFRRFSAAYALLDPATAPTFDQYQADLGRDGGLVASYAKLTDIVVDEEAVDDTRVDVSATLTFLTSLQTYEVTTVLPTVLTDEGWRIRLPAADPTTSPDQFASRPDVGFVSQGRRDVSSEATNLLDVIDRPELVVDQVRTLQIDGRWIVIGQVTNTDVVPADVTVQAQLRDPEGELLVEWDAAQVMVHKLLPGESTPFRIEFQNIAGTGDYGFEADGGVLGTNDDYSVVDAEIDPDEDLTAPVEFDPQSITPLALAPGDVVDAVEVYARAVVTDAPIPAGLQIQGLRVETTDEGEYRLHGEVRNDGVTEAAVPHLLLSYLDADDELAWVSHAYLENSIAAQSSAAFDVLIPADLALEQPDIPTAAFSGPSHQRPDTSWVDPLPLPTGSGFAAVAVTVTSFMRAGGE
ncbi:hypothetical protein [Microbacterium xanthum]|uniref:hypothetical protein n=1 Tax=Microbacterium xanthum TaxID=3079794 RepID=UPI002AD308E9|nr:hypothetical protein [Microbacterium sp. KSW-48]MDZ8171548.1 hypothetical protein [Microbacterium sp. KSW-48]